MTNLLNLIRDRLLNLDLSHPLELLDLIIAISFLVAFLAYIRRFPVFRVVLGVMLLLLFSVVFFLGGFIFTGLLFGVASNLVLISLPLIFAPEIRHYLEKLGRFPFLKLPRLTEKRKKEEFIRNVVDTTFEMAERKIGALIVFERRTGLGQTIETGVITDAKFSSKLLQTIFFPKTTLHDGAVIIKGERIYAAGCLLPIQGSVQLGPPFGTRHKSGLTITMDTDAVVLIISEQRGEISIAENGKLHINLDRAELNQRLEKLL